jgi:hypothetical protein
MSDNTPTERFDSVAPEAATGDSAAAGRRPLLIALVAVGSLLLIAIIVLIIALSGRASEPAAVAPTPLQTPSLSPTPSESPSESASATPSAEPAAPSTPAPSTSPAFSRFNAPKTEDGCYYSEAPNYTPPAVVVKVKWKAVNAESVWFIQGTDDAADSMFMQVPLEGDQDDFPYPFDFGCNTESNTYTMTIVGTDGSHKSKTWKVKNTGDRY